ncbi:MAG: CoA transferase [Dehalococcoidia bacterium]|nr:MAG: CoA transferase [Dehalococcoidia bacterium]
MTGPLRSLRVVEYGQGIAAPFAGKLFADLGADVIKIEPPGGDWLRRRAPFADDGPGLERSGPFFYLNTGKRSVVLNLESETGRAIFERLLPEVDILIEDTPDGWLAERGLAPDAMRRQFPRLVLVSVTPFGRTGPHRGYRGGDFIGAAASGLAYLARPRAFADVRSELPPIRPAGNQVGFVTGLAAALGALIALFGRAKSGEGDTVDVSMQEAALAGLGPSFAQWSYQGHIVGRAALPDSAPICLMRCRDGWVWLQCSEEHHWRAFVEMMGSPDWAALDIFQDRFTRGANWDALEPLLLEWTLQHDKEEIFREAQARRIPHAPAYTFEEVLRNTHLLARGAFPAVAHPLLGDVRIPRSPLVFSATPPETRRPPLLGEHTGDLLVHLGFDRGAIAALAADGIVA